MTLKLSLPESSAGLQISADTRPKQVKAWLEALPLANIAEAARSVSDALVSLNRLPLDDDLRLRLLELYAPAIDNLVTELQPKFTLVALPLPEKSRQAATLARTLYIELAYGYKIVLLARVDKRLSFGGAQLHLIIHRAIAALSKALCIFYKTYSPTPDGFWSEIHQLAELALQRNLHDQPVDGGKHSCSSTYKQILLLALANPYKLMQDRRPRCRPTAAAGIGCRRTGIARAGRAPARGPHRRPSPTPQARSSSNVRHRPAAAPRRSSRRAASSGSRKARGGATRGAAGSRTDRSPDSRQPPIRRPLP